ncbi:MAG: hypothetical protein ACREQA_20655 [Candidatus Binatia bacterium]
MRNSSWIALAIVFLIIFFAANNTTQSGVKPDWWVNGTLIAQRSGGNFIPGANISITGVDDIANDRVNITITAAATAAFSGEVDDTTNDALTFTTDDASPPAGTTRGIYARTTDDLRYNVPTLGAHEFSVNNSTAVVIKSDRLSITGNAGVPSSIAENDIWIDNDVDHLSTRLGARSNILQNFNRRFTFATAKGASSTVVDVHGTLEGIIGSKGGVGLDADGPRVNYQTGVTSGDDAGFQGLNNLRRDWNPIAVIKFQIDATTNIRMFIGFTNLTITSSVSSDAPLAHMAGLSYSTPRGDTTFRFLSADGTAQQFTNTIAPDILSHDLIIYIDNNNSRVLFRLDNQTDVIHSTSIPGMGTDLRVIAGIETEESGVSKVIGFAYMKTESDK